MPPFTLRMLLVWVAICAVLIEFWRQGNSRSEDLAWDSLVGIKLVIWSAGLSGLGLRIWWWKQGRNIPWQPGHWLLCLVGCVGLSPILSKLVLEIFWRIDPYPNPVGLLIQQSFPYVFLLAAVLAIWGVIFFAPMRHVWTLALFPEAITRSLSLVLELYFAIFQPLLIPSGSTTYTVVIWGYGIISTISPLPILILALWDGVMNEQPRDWMHWAGVAAWSLLMLYPYLAAVVLLLGIQ
ncbi:hypothetical protein [Bremerella cremea]|nr:hypothetical protein [Bremerella cremea]